MITFGLGTGRSGSVSLAVLLNSQLHSKVYHELQFLPWEKNLTLLKTNLRYIKADLQENSMVGDVAFYLLNYVEDILHLFPEAKFVCLKRDKQSTVDSWFKHSREGNFWTSKDSVYYKTSVVDSFLDGAFPRYDLPKREAIEEYWEEYHEKAYALQHRYSENVRVYDIETLDSIEGQYAILDFIGVKSKVSKLPLMLNQDGESRITEERMPIKTGPCGFCETPESAEWYIKNEASGFMSYACDPCKKGNKMGEEFKKEVVCQKE